MKKATVTFFQVLGFTGEFRPIHGRGEFPIRYCVRNHNIKRTVAGVINETENEKLEIALRCLLFFGVEQYPRLEFYGVTLAIVKVDET